MAEQQPREMKVTVEQLDNARVELGYRDYCAHILIPLNECRLETFYLPWKCQDLRHAYEKCQYEEYLYRVKQRQNELSK